MASRSVLWPLSSTVPTHSAHQRVPLSLRGNVRPQGSERVVGIVRFPRPSLFYSVPIFLGSGALLNQKLQTTRARCPVLGPEEDHGESLQKHMLPSRADNGDRSLLLVPLVVLFINRQE